jgi:hypothetical protein
MAAPYQLASDGVAGRPYSGVIKSDGTWVPCEADNEDWKQYVEWAGDYSDNHPDPYRHPSQGGVKIVRKEGQVPVGAMLDSLPPEEGGNVVEGLPPKNVDVPMVSGDGVVGGVLACTMGNWEGEPAGYTGRWFSDADPTTVVAEGSEYTIQPGDAGHSITCVVSCFNKYGTGVAPPSNAVAIPVTVDPPARSAPPHQVEAEHENHRRHTRSRD